MRNFEKENPSLAKTQSQGPIQQPQRSPIRRKISYISFGVGVFSIAIALLSPGRDFPTFWAAMFASSVLVGLFFGEGSQDTNATLGDSPSSSSFTHDPFERNHIPDLTSSSGDSYYDAPRSECWYTDSTNPLSPLNPTNRDD